MRLLAFSDLHVDLGRAEELARRSSEVDVVVGAGDFASVHRGLEQTIAALAVVEKPTVLVPGNNETEEALRSACASWGAARVLHADSSETNGITFYGLGAGVPVTPWDWSYDLTEDEASTLLEGCPEGSVLVSHSPPRGHCDRSGSGEHLGSEAVLRAVEERRPRLVLCGHIHESWGETSKIGEAEIVNLGPDGRVIEL